MTAVLAVPRLRNSFLRISLLLLSSKSVLSCKIQKNGARSSFNSWRQPSAHAFRRALKSARHWSSRPTRRGPKFSPSAKGKPVGKPGRDYANQPLRCLLDHRHQHTDASSVRPDSKKTVLRRGFLRPSCTEPTGKNSSGLLRLSRQPIAGPSLDLLHFGVARHLHHNLVESAFLPVVGAVADQVLAV